MRKLGQYLHALNLGGVETGMLSIFLLAAVPGVAALAVEATNSGAHSAVGDLYLADDFTDRGCATAAIVSRYQPMLGYNASMAAQIDSYLSDDFSNQVASASGPMVAKSMASSYQPLVGYITTPLKR